MFPVPGLSGALVVISICTETGTRMAPFAGVIVAVVVVGASPNETVAVCPATTLAVVDPVRDVPGTNAVMFALPTGAIALNCPCAFTIATNGKPFTETRAVNEPKAMPSVPLIVLHGMPIL